MKINWKFQGRGGTKQVIILRGSYGYFLESHVNSFFIVNDASLTSNRQTAFKI